eukprot:scaffold25392_cov72-Phaeocystis_antarctica.AAC.2
MEDLLGDDIWPQFNRRNLRRLHHLCDHAAHSCCWLVDSSSWDASGQEAPKRRCNCTVEQRHHVSSLVPYRRHVLAARWNAPELCRAQQLVRPAEHVQRRYCDRLGHIEVLACGKKLPWRAAEVDVELERRRARRHCGRDERAIGDAADTADRSVLLDPAFHVSHALANCSGAACLVHRCRHPAKVAGAVVLSRCSEACEQLGLWAHGMRRVEKLYLKAVRSEFGQPARELQYPAHQRAVPCLAVQHEQPPGGRVEQVAGSRAQLCAVVACHLLRSQRSEFELSDDLFHRALCSHQPLYKEFLHIECLRQLVTKLHHLHRGESKRLVLGARVHRRTGHLGEDPAGSFHSRVAAAAGRQREAARHGRKRAVLEEFLRCTKPFTQLGVHVARLPERIHRPSARRAVPCPTRCCIGTTPGRARGHRSLDLAQSVYSVDRRRLVPSAQRLTLGTWDQPPVGLTRGREGGARSEAQC